MHNTDEFESCKIKKLILDNPNLTKASQWFELAQDYYYAKNGKILDYEKIRICCKIALTFDKQYSSALLNLGYLYWFGLSVAEDRNKARKYYESVRNVNETTLILSNPDLTTAQQWNDLGENYYYGKNGCEKRLLNSACCYSIALRLDQGHQYALYSLGWQFHYGEGVDKNLPEAHWCFEAASKLGHYESLKQLLRLDNPKLTTADQWCNLAKDYYCARNGKSFDYAKMRACCEIALTYDKQWGRALVNLGIIYGWGLGVDKNLIKANEYHRQATNSVISILILKYPALVTAQQWCVLGDNYYYGKDGHEKNYVNAVCCYSIALKLDQGHQYALYSLGCQFYYGEGVDKNLPEAYWCFEAASKLGHYGSLKQLLRLDNPKLTTADQWCNLARDYYCARNGKSFDYAKIRACCEIALTYDKQSGRTLGNLGIIYGWGLGVDKNLIKANEYHRQATNSAISILILKYPALVTAQQWCDLGDNYYYGKDGYEKNYANAVACFEIAHVIQRDHQYALYLLGWQFHYGQGVDKNLPEAYWCFEAASKLGHYESLKQLLRLDNPKLTTADQWCNLARDYYCTRNGKSFDYAKIRACCEIALTYDKQWDRTLVNLGIIYGWGLGVDKNLIKANEYHRQATNSVISILILKYPALVTAQQWCDLGDNYYYGKDGHEKNYANAVACFEIAHLIQRDHQYALYSLGWQFHYGQGVDKNLPEAHWCFEAASKLGHYGSLKQLLRLDNPKLTTADQWFHLAQNYYSGKNNKSQDYRKARACFEIIFLYDKEHISTHLFLGYMYEHGLGVDENFDEADKHYEYLRNSKLSVKKTHLKRFERKRIEKAFDNRQNLNVIDESKRTALHRAAQMPAAKLYAKLRNLRLDHTRMDGINQTPEDYLINGLLEKTAAMQSHFTRFIGLFFTAAPKIIAHHISFQGIVLDDEGERSKLAIVEELYTIPTIQPLLELSKLAMLGRHELSERPSAIQDDYDSDNDEKEVLTEECFLQIIIDPTRETVEHIAPGGKPGDKGSWGMHWPTDRTRNIVWVGGLRPSPLPRATMIHELCHFIANEIYRNNCFPYSKNDIANKARFIEIADELEWRKVKLDRILCDAFGDSYQKKNQVHCELIVRVAELIVTKPNGLVILKQQAPDLWDYYENTFLVHIKNHINKLQARAFGHWSPGLFKPETSSDVFLNTAINEDEETRQYNHSS